MKRRCLPVVQLCVLLTSQLSHAATRLGDDTEIVFANVAQAKETLTRPDDFVRRMSPFDRAARMKTDRQVSQAEYLTFVGNQVLAWDAAEQAKVTSALATVASRLVALAPEWPKQILLIETTGKEEGGAAYTRSNAVILSRPTLAATAGGLRKLLAHELFHILSRHDPKLREKLYGAIGFERCREPELLAMLAARRITNPDAPSNDHCIRLSFRGKSICAVPILLSATDRYDRVRGGEFFDYLQLRFIAVRPAGSRSEPKGMRGHGESDLLEPQALMPGILRQIGTNTGYVIHPEEVLADNFALLILGRRDVPSPEVLERMERILEEAGRPGRTSPAGSARSSHPAGR